MPTSVINDIVSWERCPTFAPSTTRIRENSLIWATAVPARKPVLFLYPRNPMSAMTMRGLPTRMNAESVKAGKMAVPRDENVSFAPSEMKKRTIKKSLRLRIFPEIS